MEVAARRQNLPDISLTIDIPDRIAQPGNHPFDVMNEIFYARLAFLRSLTGRTSRLPTRADGNFEAI